MKFSAMFQPFTLLERIRHPVMTNNFQESFVGAVNVLELHIKNRIDPMLAQQRTEAVLKPEAGKDRALSGRGLAVKIELAGPPGIHAILQLYGATEKAVARLGKSGN